MATVLVGIRHCVVTSLVCANDVTIVWSEEMLTYEVGQPRSNKEPFFFFYELVV